MTYLFTQSSVPAGDDSNVHALLENPNSIIEAIGPEGGAVSVNDDGTEVAMCFSSMMEVQIPESNGKYTAPINLTGEFVVEVDGVLIPHYFTDEQLGKFFNRGNVHGVEFVEVETGPVISNVEPAPFNFSLPDTGQVYRLMAELGPEQGAVTGMFMMAADYPQVIPGPIGDFYENTGSVQIDQQSFGGYVIGNKSRSTTTSPATSYFALKTWADGPSGEVLNANFYHTYLNENGQTRFNPINSDVIKETNFEVFHFMRPERAGLDVEKTGIVLVEFDSSKLVFAQHTIPDLTNLGAPAAPLVKVFEHDIPGGKAVDGQTSPDAGVLIRTDFVGGKRVINSYYYDENVDGIAFVTTPITASGDSTQLDIPTGGGVSGENDIIWREDNDFYYALIFRDYKMITAKIANDGTGVAYSVTEDGLSGGIGGTVALEIGHSISGTRVFAYNRADNKYGIYLFKPDGTVELLHSDVLQGHTVLSSMPANFTSPFENTVVVLTGSAENGDATTQLIIDPVTNLISFEHPGTKSEQPGV